MRLDFDFSLDFKIDQIYVLLVGIETAWPEGELIVMSGRNVTARRRDAFPIPKGDSIIEKMGVIQSGKIMQLEFGFEVKPLLDF